MPPCLLPLPARQLTLNEKNQGSTDGHPSITAQPAAEATEKTGTDDHQAAEAHGNFSPATGWALVSPWLAT
jgi:hypothetical protein